MFGALSGYRLDDFSLEAWLQREYRVTLSKSWKCQGFDYFDSAAPSLPSSANIKTLVEAQTYWNTHFRGKTFDLTVHSRKPPQQGGYPEKQIKVSFGNTNHAYSDRPEGASHWNNERAFNPERARMMSTILNVIQYPYMRLISRGNDLLLAAPSRGRYYTIALVWRDELQVYTFESAHFKNDVQIQGIRNAQRNEKANKNKGSLQK